MRLRCVRLLEGLRHGGREITQHGSLTIGKEYIVLAMSCRAADGAAYLLLRDDDDTSTQTMLCAAEMFEITSSKIPSSWEVASRSDAVRMQPAAWLHAGAFWDRKSGGDKDAHALFRREVEEMYSEEGQPSPYEHPELHGT